MENKVVKRFGVLKIIIAVLVIILVVAAIYFTFFYNYRCNSYECFSKSMSSCDKSSYINEQPEASWGYNIMGESQDSCNIKVTLLQAKKGQLGIDKLNGLDMICSYPLGGVGYPEKDLSKCHGRLKEEIQTIIINKLHTHIIENLGQFNQSLNSLI